MKQVTTDLWFASFLLLKGQAVEGFIKLGPRKGQYEFNMSSEEWKAFKLAFIKSDASKLKQHQEQLKDLLY